MTQSTRSRLDQNQARLLGEIGVAAKAADPTKILALTEELSRTTALLARIDAIDSEAKSLLAIGASDHLESPDRQIIAQGAFSVPGRGEGIEIRTAFLQRAAEAGLPLRPYRGAILMSPGGRRIGVAVATERNRDRWFLGLGEDLFDAAVLLCKPNTGRVLDVCIPSAFFAKHGRHLSRSGDQVKFNVARRDSHLVLKIPGHGAQDVDRFVGAIAGVDR